MRATYLCGMLCAGLLPSGCGGPDVKEVQLVQIGGTVTLDTQPVVGAAVIFEAEDGSFSFAETDADGHYELWFDSQTRGVTPGPKVVQISMNRRLLGLNSNDEGGPEDSAGGSFVNQPAEAIPAEYNLQSELKVDVRADSRQFDFELFSAP